MDDDDIQNLAIDIHVGKLVEWLVSRQHSSKDWAESSRVVREKINAAIQDMPEHKDITKLLSGTYINYFHCLRIVEILRETEADSKNILGWYTSQRMKDWQAVLKLYEKGGTYLAESGQLLHSYVAYEIPGIRGQMARCVQIQQECDKKEADSRKSASVARNAYLKHCKQLGIEGDSVRRELLGLLAELPSELTAVGSDMRELSEAVQYYSSFVLYTSHHKASNTTTLPMLQYIIEHGNVTTYEHLHNEAPLSVEDPTDALLQENGNKHPSGDGDDQGIDFGESGDGDEGGIDFGEGGNDDDQGIDFGDGGADGGGIDFGDSGEIDFVDGVAADVAAAITVEECGVAGGVARGTEALTILQNDSTRDRILDDLYELEGFLKQRVLESNSEEDSMVALNLWDEAPKSLQMVSTTAISGHLAGVHGIMRRLSTPKMQQLLLISASHRYVDRLTQQLQQQEQRSHVPSSVLQQLQQRREQSSKQQQELQQQLKQLQTASKKLCQQVQGAVSGKYKGRPVNIMGVNQSL